RSLKRRGTTLSGAGSAAPPARPELEARGPSRRPRPLRAPRRLGRRELLVVPRRRRPGEQAARLVDARAPAAPGRPPPLAPDDGASARDRPQQGRRARGRPPLGL